MAFLNLRKIIDTTHQSSLVELPEDGSIKYYLDEERQYYVPKRKRKDISIIR